MNADVPRRGSRSRFATAVVWLVFITGTNAEGCARTSTGDHCLRHSECATGQECFDGRCRPLIFGDGVFPSDGVSEGDGRGGDASRVGDFVSSGDTESGGDEGPLSSDLIAYYRFEDDPTGGLLSDSSLSANHGTTSNVGAVKGPDGSAILLGSTSSVTVPDDASLDVTDGLTLAMWVRAASIPTTGRAGLVDKQSQYSLWIYPGGELLCRNSGTAGLSLPGVIEVGVWTHVACTFDRVEYRGYINGVFQDSAAETRAIPSGSGDVLTIGSDSPSADVDRFDGALDEVQIWRVPLPQSEICVLAGSC